MSPPEPAQDQSTAPALAVSGLHKAFGEIRAVDGVSFTVGRGEIVGLRTAMTEVKPEGQGSA